MTDYIDEENPLSDPILNLMAEYINAKEEEDSKYIHYLNPLVAKKLETALSVLEKYCSSVSYHNKISVKYDILFCCLTVEIQTANFMCISEDMKSDVFNAADNFDIDVDLSGTIFINLTFKEAFIKGNLK